MNEAQNFRVTQLLQQSRYPDAEAFLRGVLTQEPDNPQALLLMAIVLTSMDKHTEAQGAVLMALRQDPQNAMAMSWKARILLALDRHQEAMQSADEAIQLDADEPFHWTTKGLIHAKRRQWKEAEAAARSALELDPDDEGAHHLLSQSLLYMGKTHENEANISSRLADDPENPIAHCNAGFAALRRGDHLKASVHFAEALRLDASCEMARDGLIESYRARSAFYRLYLAFNFRMAAFSEKYGSALMIGIWLLYSTIRSFLKGLSPTLATAFTFLYLMFVFWSYVARGLSTFFLLTDRLARQALRPREKTEAVLVGGGFSTGAVLIGLGVITQIPFFSLLGGVLAAQAIPASLFLTKESKAGRLLYGTSAGITWLCSLVVLAAIFIPGLPKSVFMGALTTGLATVGITTFLAAFGVAKR